MPAKKHILMVIFCGCFSLKVNYLKGVGYTQL